MSSSVFSPLWRYRKRLAVGWWLVPVQVLKGRFVLHVTFRCSALANFCIPLFHHRRMYFNLSLPLLRNRD